MRKLPAGRHLAMIIGIAALTAGCGGGGGGSSSTAPGSGSASPPATQPGSSGSVAPGGSPAAGVVSVAAASADPCLLVSRAAAVAILKAPVGKPTAGWLGTFNGCTYTSSGGTIVIVSIDPVPLTAAGESVIKKPAPVSGLGHQAVCGSSGLGSYTLEGALDSLHSVQVVGPSCSAATQFAARVYGRL